MVQGHQHHAFLDNGPLASERVEFRSHSSPLAPGTLVSSAAGGRSSLLCSLWLHEPQSPSAVSGKRLSTVSNRTGPLRAGFVVIRCLLLPAAWMGQVLLPLARRPCPGSRSLVTGSWCYVARPDGETRELALDRATCLSRAFGFPEVLLPITHCPLADPDSWALGPSHVQCLTLELELPVPSTLGQRTTQRGGGGVLTTQGGKMSPGLRPASATALGDGQAGSASCGSGPGVQRGGAVREKPWVGGGGWARQGLVGTAL